VIDLLGAEQTFAEFVKSVLLPFASILHKFKRQKEILPSAIYSIYQGTWGDVDLLESVNVATGPNLIQFSQ